MTFGKWFERHLRALMMVAAFTLSAVYMGIIFL